MSFKETLRQKKNKKYMEKDCYKTTQPHRNNHLKSTVNCVVFCCHWFHNQTIMEEMLLKMIMITIVISNPSFLSSKSLAEQCTVF